MIPECDRAYIAGLFDGEGCVSYKQYNRKRKNNKKAYPTWQIRLEIAMTDQSVLLWLNEVLGVGTVGEKRYKTKYTAGWKKQWRWRCSHRDAFYVCCLIPASFCILSENASVCLVSLWFLSAKGEAFLLTASLSVFGAERFGLFRPDTAF